MGAPSKKKKTISHSRKPKSRPPQKCEKGGQVGGGGVKMKFFRKEDLGRVASCNEEWRKNRNDLVMPLVGSRDRNENSMRIGEKKVEEDVSVSKGGDTGGKERREEDWKDCAYHSLPKRGGSGG